jgi:hypothetical protein
LVNDNKELKNILDNSSIRKNLVSWYPFKQNSRVLEFCEKKSVVTEELRNKCKNVTTIELSKIKKIEDIKEKYDYIFFNGIFEYCASFIKSDASFEDFIKKIKLNLKPNGKILISTDNKMGLKYWCGVNDADTKLLTKIELEKIIENCNMKANFYYMFPNRIYPQVIYTDASLKRKVYANYLPFYSDEPTLFFNETSVYRKLYNNDLISSFANSFFIEISNEKTDIEVDFVKFNSFRKDEYNLYTYSKDKKYYKKESNDRAMNFLKAYSNSSKELEKTGFSAIEIKKDKEGYYTDEVLTYSFLDKILNDYKVNGEEHLLDNLKEYEKYLSSKYNIYIDIPDNNVFDKYNAKINKRKMNKLHFLKKAYIDIIPQNMLYHKKDYYLIDQEWIMDNVPYEFILYRGIINVFQNLDNGYELANKYLTIFNLIEFSSDFSKLEKNFQISTLGNQYDLFDNKAKFKTNDESIKKIIQENNKIKDQEIEKKDKIIIELENKVADLNQTINNILNSGSWKITKPIRYVKKIIKKK